MLFSQNESFWTIKISFHYGRKIGIFPKGSTDDSGQKFQISFKPTLLEKRPRFFRSIMLFYQNVSISIQSDWKASWDTSLTTVHFRESLLYKPTPFFYYNQKICIFPEGLTHDSGKKIPNVFPAYFSVLETPLFYRLMMLFSQKEAFRPH